MTNDNLNNPLGYKKSEYKPVYNTIGLDTDNVENNKINPSGYNYEEVTSEEVASKEGLKVGIEHDPRFKGIIDAALKNVDLTEEALMENQEVVARAKEIAAEKGGDWKKYLWKASVAFITASVMNACYYPGVKPENKEGALINVLIACSKPYGGKEGRMCREAMLDGKDVVVRDANVYGRKVKTDQAAEHGKAERPAVHCRDLPTRAEQETCIKSNNGNVIYVEETRSQRDQRKYGLRQPVATGNIQNNGYNTKTTDSQYKLKTMTDITEDVNEGRQGSGYGDILKNINTTNNDLGTPINQGQKNIGSGGGIVINPDQL